MLGNEAYMIGMQDNKGRESYHVDHWKKYANQGIEMKPLTGTTYHTATIYPTANMAMDVLKETTSPSTLGARLVKLDRIPIGQPNLEATIKTIAEDLNTKAIGSGKRSRYEAEHVTGAKYQLVEYRARG